MSKRTKVAIIVAGVLGLLLYAATAAQKMEQSGAEALLGEASH
jgi:hypothetical protein